MKTNLRKRLEALEHVLVGPELTAKDVAARERWASLLSWLLGEDLEAEDLGPVGPGGRPWSAVTHADLTMWASGLS